MGRCHDCLLFYNLSWPELQKRRLAVVHTLDIFPRALGHPGVWYKRTWSKSAPPTNRASYAQRQWHSIAYCTKLYYAWLKFNKVHGPPPPSESSFAGEAGFCAKSTSVTARVSACVLDMLFTNSTVATQVSRPDEALLRRDANHRQILSEAELYSRYVCIYEGLKMNIWTYLSYIYFAYIHSISLYSYKYIYIPCILIYYT